MVCRHKLIDGGRVGPTGRKVFSIRVNRCVTCGAIIPIHPEKLSYQECAWIERYNNHCLVNNKKRGEING